MPVSCSVKACTSEGDQSARSEPLKAATQMLKRPPPAWTGIASWDALWLSRCGIVERGRMSGVPSRVCAYCMYAAWATLEEQWSPSLTESPTESSNRRS